MSARTKHRLEKRVDEMHGWALERSNEEVVAFETQLEEETYRHVLEKEACHMRAKNQKKKDKDSLAQAEERQTRLEGLMVAAEVASKHVIVKNNNCDGLFSFWLMLHYPVHKR